MTAASKSCRPLWHAQASTFTFASRTTRAHFSISAAMNFWNFSREPKAFELRPPLDAHVSLTATTFQASFH